ncbi:5388_t:CDS:2, partial [Funneliformis caledonium]
NINSSPNLPCLSSIEGPVIYPDDIRFQSLIIDHNIRVNYTPSVLIYAINEADVIKAVKCAVNSQNGIIARSGGHSNEKYGLGGRNDTIVLDVTFINDITVYRDHRNRNVAKIGAGNRLGNVYNKLNQEGFFIPAGSCPSVGIAGHALGGGYGFYGREYGLACDNIISMNMVDAKGNLLENIESSNHYFDLFFALRGAGGGSYGIVTHFLFEIHPIPERVTYMSLEFNAAQVRQLIKAFNEAEVNPRLENKTTLRMKLEKKRSILKLSIIGLYLGNRKRAEAEIDKLLTKTETTHEPKIKPILLEYVEQTFFESVENLATSSEPPFPLQSKYEVVSPVHNIFKVKTFLVNQGEGLTRKAIDELVKFLNEVPCDTSATFELWGGKINHRDDTSSFIHRDVLYCIILTSETSKEQSTKCVDKINDFGRYFQSNFTSYYSYQNFIDRDLDDWETRYYGNNFLNLKEIKFRYDPNNLFNFNQSIYV